MKKLLSLILWLCCLLFAWSFVQANNSEYEYKNLNITADILEDGTMNVRESFKANFFVEKHWIIRTIPLNYSVWGMYYHIDISDIDVKWQPFTTTQGSGSREIKIWDSDKTITWEQRYPITYTVYGLIKNYEWMWYSELYWNLVWYDFDTNINSVRAVLHLPKVYTGFTSNDFLITTDWKSNSVEDFSWTVDWSQWDSISITYESWLDANQWITLSIKFPEDYFEFDDDRQTWLMWKAKIKDTEPEEPTKLIAENIVDNDEEIADSEQSHFAPETTGSSIVEQDEVKEEIINDLVEDNISSDDTSIEEKTKANAVTNNGYVTSGAKPTLNSNPEYEYTNLNITAKILDDGTMTVKENYTADFHINKHGIIRTIPLNYTVSGFAFHIDVSDINVEWKTFRTSKAGWDIEIKIWDADRTVIGTQNYPISYTTYWLVRNFSGEWFSDFYWNLVWYDFDTSIRNVYAEIILPSVYTWFTAEDFQITVDWNTGNVFLFPWLVDWGQWDRIIIKYDRWLSAYKWITLSIKFPNNYFTFDHDKQAKLVWHVNSSSSSNYNYSWGGLLDKLNNVLAGIVPFWMIALFIYTFIRKIKSAGKIDTKSGALKWEFAKQFPVIVQYEAPKWINSAEAGLLLHRGARVKDMLSLIYKRAAEWLIRISTEESSWSVFKRASKSIILTKIKDISSDAPEYEKDFFRSLVRSEKNKIEETTNLYGKLHLSDLEKYGETKWWLTTNKKAKLILIFFFSLFIIAPLVGPVMPALVAFLVLVFFFFTVTISSASLKETEEWAKLIAHILWYRDFLKACDENKLRLFLQQDPLYFDKILPYAVAFWLDTELIKKIEPIMQEMNIHSTWYDWDLHSMTTINNIISSSATHYSAPQSPSYSSGGWFSWGSSSGWGFSSWGWGWWGGWRSW